MNLVLSHMIFSYTWLSSNCAWYPDIQSKMGIISSASLFLLSYFGLIHAGRHIPYRCMFFEFTYNTQQNYYFSYSEVAL